MRYLVNLSEGPVGGGGSGGDHRIRHSGQKYRLRKIHILSNHIDHAPLNGRVNAILNCFANIYTGPREAIVGPYSINNHIIKDWTLNINNRGDQAGKLGWRLLSQVIP
jgi:hypothetical protein